MSKITKINADRRELLGSKVKKLRNEGLIPANIFGSDIESVAITLAYDDFRRAFERAGETGIIEVSLSDEKRSVLVSDIQFHPVTDSIVHVDLREVDLKKKVSAMVPVELIGESPAEKNGIGVLVQHVNELEVEALPLDLPESFELDVSGLETLEDSLSVADINVDTTKVEIDAEPELIVANITEIREEEPEPEPEVDDEEAEAADGEEKPGDEAGDGVEPKDEDSSEASDA